MRTGPLNPSRVAVPRESPGRGKGDAVGNRHPRPAWPGDKRRDQRITYGELVAVLERFAEGQDESMSASRGWSTAISPGCGPSSPWPRLVLHDVPPHLNEILRIPGWGATPGLTLDERSSPPAIPPARLHLPPVSGPEGAMTYAERRQFAVPPPCRRRPPVSPGLALRERPGRRPSPFSCAGAVTGFRRVWSPRGVPGRSESFSTANTGFADRSVPEELMDER